MNILYDGEIYKLQSAGGINRYFANLIGHLPNDFSPFISARQIPSLHWPKHPNLKVIKYRQFKPRRISTALEKPYFDFALGRRKYDIFHPTYYSSLVQRDWKIYGCPTVLTVYDMIHELFADYMDPSGYYQAEKCKAVADAQAILCISEHTKHDLIKYYAVPESKITVTYLAADLDISSSYGPETVPDRPYFLYIGTRASYKNFDGLLQAFSKVATSKRDFALCIVGSALTKEESETIDVLGLSQHIEFYGHANDQQLAKLYRCSLAFVYPSLYEGFGIPPLEAMQCGTIVVASNVSSIPEVVGDAGISFDPHNIDNLADILLSIINGDVNRHALIERGYERAKEFSWQETADETTAVYRSLAS